MTAPGTSRPWVVISNYPAWPSPYFAELARHAPPALRLTFAAALEDLLTQGPAGVINLHRLKRLYQEPDGQRTRAAAETMLRHLAQLREVGWKLVWTVHNLLPIDGEPPSTADRYAADGVLALADAVVAHTRADADHLRTLTRAPVTVAGWAAPTPEPGPPPAQIAALAGRIAAAPFAVVVLGNITAYKDLPRVVDAFTAATHRAELFILGPSREPDLVSALYQRTDTERRVHLHPHRIPAGHLHVLYRAADVALCPYRADGPWEFFTRMIHPSSVGAALSCNIPVIGPDLPALREMTEGREARLYDPVAGPGPALAAAENAPPPTTPPRPPDPAPRWRSIGAVYAELAATVHTTHQRPGPLTHDRRSPR